jgi:uncharacterized protein (TIGR03083 family)
MGNPLVENWDVIADERRALADQLEGLTDEQWATASLCGDWTVRDLAGHLVVVHKLSIPGFLLEVVKARGSFDKANSRVAVREGARPTADLVADLRRFAEDRFTPPGFGSEAPLSDVLIHGCDIRVPLGLEPPRPPEAWRRSLDFLVSAKARRGFVGKALPAVRLVATDIGWSHGSGDEVRASAANLGMAISGRRARLHEVGGPGAPELVAWASA